MAERVVVVAIGQKVEPFSGSVLGALESSFGRKSSRVWRRRVQISCGTRRSPHGMSKAQVGDGGLPMVDRALAVA